MFIRRGLGLFSLALLGIAGPAAANTMTSTSYSGWLTNVTGPVDVFGNAPTSGTFDTSSGISLSNSSHPSAVFVFTGPDNGGWVLTAGSCGTCGGATYPNTLKGPGDGIGNITVSMPTGGENAVMLALGTSEYTALTVKLSDGETFTPAAGIFGLALSHDISWLTVSTTNGSNPIIYDFAYASSTLTQDAPPSIEASTIIMIGGGLLILLGGRRKLFS